MLKITLGFTGPIVPNTLGLGSQLLRGSLGYVSFLQRPFRLDGSLLGDAGALSSPDEDDALPNLGTGRPFELLINKLALSDID